MSERMFRVLQGIILLAGLYFDLRWLIYGLIVVLLFEGITNLRFPLLISRMRGVQFVTNPECVILPGASRINFEAERVLRLAVAGFLIISYLLFSEQLWFFPWFIGFALFAAGLSGMCPMVMGFRWLGFR